MRWPGCRLAWGVSMARIGPATDTVSRVEPIRIPPAIAACAPGYGRGGDGGDLAGRESDRRHPVAQGTRRNQVGGGPGERGQNAQSDQQGQGDLSP